MAEWEGVDMPQLDLTGAKPDWPLEERIARLEDLEAIRNLKMQYASYCDQGYDPDGIGSLFVEDGVWEANAFGTYHGVEAIKGFFASVSGSIVWVLHYTMNPMIEIAPDGQSATASWLLLGPATMLRSDGSGERDAVLMAGSYRDTMVKQDGQWKFKQIKVQLDCVSNVDQGWVRQQYRP